MMAEPLVAPSRESGAALPRGRSRVTLAVDVGGTRTRVAIVRNGVIGERIGLGTEELATSGLARPGRGLVDPLVAASRTLIEGAGLATVDAVGIAVAAFVDAAGAILQPREFGIPGGTIVRDAFAEALGALVLVDNDANLAALAEWSLGEGRGRATVAVLTLGTNIGLGLVIDGRIHRGGHGAAGEAGLLLVPVVDTGRRIDGRPLVDAGPFGQATSQAPAGYAWAEELVGGGALAAAAGAGATSARVLASTALDDPATRIIAARAIEGWAYVIATITVLVDPDVVVLSGGLARDSAHLLDVLRRRVGELVPFQPEIRLGRLGADAELLGADLLARSALDSRAIGHARAGLAARLQGGDP
jgi:predicted NBD/HSP70 family sugar kinase